MAAFPQRWWKKHPLVFAHRGANLHAPENTLSAFRKAVQMGADGFELDVRLTSDGIPVVLHDARVDSTTDGRGAISHLTLREVKALDAGSWFCNTCSETIPTLEEVLEELGRKTLINIELKGLQRKELHLAESVCVLVKKMALEEHVWFSSFKPYLLHLTRKYLPKVPNGYLYTMQSPVNKFIRITTPIEAVHPYYRMVDRDYVSRMHGFDKRVVVWTVDDTETAQRCIDANVDVIITNDPEKMIRIVG